MGRTLDYTNITSPMEHVPYPFFGCRDDDTWEIFHMNIHGKKFFKYNSKGCSQKSAECFSLSSLFSANVLTSLKNSPDNVFVIGRCLKGGDLYIIQAHRPLLPRNSRKPIIIFVAIRKAVSVLPDIYDSAFCTERILSKKLTIDDVCFSGQRVIMRVDFNVPMSSDHTQITNDYRIQATLPSIRKILADRPKFLILISHWGQPLAPRYDKRFSLRPIVPYLQTLIGPSTPIIFSEDCMNAGNVLRDASPESIILLENLRFAAGEKSNADPSLRSEMAAKLASYADIYVNDAFGVAHRSAVSTVDLPKRIETSVAGHLVNRELQYLSNFMRNPVSPIMAIVGGAKITDKIKLLKKLITKVDLLAIGGAMANPFLKAKGICIGKSYMEKDTSGNEITVGMADDIMKLIARYNNSRKKKIELILPLDHAISPAFHDTRPLFTESTEVPTEMMALDIGPKTVKYWCELLMKSKTILWMGPVGVFEYSNFRNGSVGIATAIGHATERNGAISVAGGGDTVSAVQIAGIGDKISHVSTGGGATLSFLEGEALPGIIHLTTRVQAKL